MFYDTPAHCLCLCLPPGDTPTVLLPTLIHSDVLADVHKNKLDNGLHPLSASVCFDMPASVRLCLFPYLSLGVFHSVSPVLHLVDSYNISYSGFFIAPSYGLTLHG